MIFNAVESARNWHWCPSGVRKESVIFTVRWGWAIHPLWFRTNICVNGRESKIVWTTFRSKDKKEALPDPRGLIGLACFCIGTCIEFVQSWQAQNNAWSWPQFPVANWYFIPWLKQDAWQSEHCNEISQKLSLSSQITSKCFTNICSISESEQIDCKPGRILINGLL